MSRDLFLQVQAGLHALADVLPTGFDADRLEQSLSLIGDGLRLEAELPRAILRWLEGRTRDERRAVLETRRDVLIAQLLPPSDEPDERLELAVHARDEAESVLVATRRLERGDTWEAPGFAELDEVCAAFDAHVERFGREAVERALGPRAEMLGPGHWASRLPEHQAKVSDQDVRGIPRGEGRPSDEAIRAFVQDGRHHRTVLGLAESDAPFAEELDEIFRAMLDSGERIGLAARRWARDRAASSSASSSTSSSTSDTPVPFPLGLKRAAADHAHDKSVLEDLGRLAPIEARAHLVIERGHAVLELQADEDLAEVKLGGVAGTKEGALWTARVPYTRTLSLSVRASDGRVFDVTLDLEADA